MPMHMVVVTERRTYEIDADSEAAAIERALGEPEDLPIGSLVSAVRSHPEIIRSESSKAEQDASAHATEPGRAVPDVDPNLLNQPWG